MRASLAFAATLDEVIKTTTGVIKRFVESAAIFFEAVYVIWIMRDHKLGSRNAERQMIGMELLLPLLAILGGNHDMAIRDAIEMAL